ncbi:MULTISPECIES: hypothetical protein [Mycobacterium]|uniref:Proline rich protein n=1 Tax=Mycobacterium kiyosense TaxID=2871094 RepID=A0A9P3V1Q8_9MYCO|nr:MULTISPECIES: hypothetical protein [Mycobacterium]BDB41113.1 hypothetical protein IWGMT90018_15590 [Mycobacterium kiyosense]BDE12905.1 hypothetical protein MKCMC460_17650 [Mycobacterium sp. 20KCMC460]GLB85296.1 hypothetical protein SRL2020028_45520 [Mycobacterium kiyosense]GLB92230.1 hypothetical protein SRL2020130_50470 [Mycobacterium kiyosense]GLB98342.1 hypothetical protein SRL2020226_51180 [Mycobacterium kiyosense]
MKLQLNLLQRRRDAERRTPTHLFGGRVRTSTLVLIVAFAALWWTYETYSPQEKPASTTPSQVVPPGFVPDPNYTWVPRTRLQQPTTTWTPPPATTTTTKPPPTTTTTTTPSPSPPPCLLPPPFCPATSTPSPTPSPQQPEPGQTPTPTSAPAAPPGR